MEESLSFSKKHRGIDTKRDLRTSENDPQPYSEDEYVSSDQEYPNRMVSSKSLRSLAMLNNNNHGNNINLNRRYYSQMISDYTDNDNNYSSGNMNGGDDYTDNMSYITFNEAYKNNLSEMNKDYEFEEDEGKQHKSTGTIDMNQLQESQHYRYSNPKIEKEDEEDGIRAGQENDATYLLLDNDNNNSNRMSTDDQRYEGQNNTYKSISSIVKSFFKSKYNSSEETTKKSGSNKNTKYNTLDNNEILGLIDTDPNDLEVEPSFDDVYTIGKDKDSRNHTKTRIIHDKNKGQTPISRNGSSKTNSIRTFQVTGPMNEREVEGIEHHLNNNSTVRSRSNSTLENREIFFFDDEDDDDNENAIFISNINSKKRFLVNFIMVVCSGLIIIVVGFVIGVFVAVLSMP